MIRFGKKSLKLFFSQYQYTLCDVFESYRTFNNLVFRHCALDCKRMRQVIVHASNLIKSKDYFTYLASKVISLSCYFQIFVLRDFDYNRLVHIVWDFRPWIVLNASFSIFGPLRRPQGQNTGRSRSFASLQIMFNLFETSNYKFEPSKNNALLSLCPMDENPGRHEQVYSNLSIVRQVHFREASVLHLSKRHHVSQNCQLQAPRY